MKHFTALKKDKIDSIAIGVFDGFHLGHKELLKRLTPNGAILIIYKEIANITPGFTRERFSPYPCIFMKFASIKGLDCAEFISILMSHFPSLKKIVVGYDFKFGANRACDIYDLKQMFAGKIDVVDEFFIDGVSVHSSKIREFIKNGEIKKANTFLGREYSIVGKVIKGQGLGKKELFPTLNIEIQKYIMPKNGVYATRVLIEDKLYDSVTFIGIRESTDGNFACETHVIDKDISQIDEVEIFFVDFIRENKKFDSLSELKDAIKKDITVSTNP
ncbi:MAG: bifunctional riboflavin kinase/FAD synthetase [Sulfurospirillum sp.]